MHVIRMKLWTRIENYILFMNCRQQRERKCHELSPGATRPPSMSAQAGKSLQVCTFGILISMERNKRERKSRKNSVENPPDQSVW